MFDQIFVTVVCVIEMFISYMVFSKTAKRKRSLWIVFSLGALLFASAAAVNLVFSNNIWVNGAYFLIVNFAFAKLFFEITTLNAAFYSVLLDVISTALEFVIIFLFSLILKVGIGDYKNETSLLVIEGLLSKTAYFATSLLISSISKKNMPRTKYPSSYYFYLLAVMVSLFGFWKIFSDEPLSHRSQTILSFICLLLFATTVFLFVSYQYFVEKENYFISMSNEVSHYKSEKSYYNVLEQQDLHLMAYAHDLNKHLTVVKSLNTNPVIDTYIDEMAEQLRIYSETNRSGNKILDVIVEKYTVECKTKGIEFICDVSLDNLIQLDEFDLMTVLGNLLDNAVEAAEKSVRKKIEFETHPKNTYSIICISNSCDVAPKPLGNSETLISTKTDAGVHGFGLQNVRTAIEKYGGDMLWKYLPNEKRFQITAFVRKKQK